MSGLYLLDTDICAFVLRRSSAALLERIQSVPLAQQAISVVTYAELLYGVQVSSKARHYAEIRADLKKKGAMIGANDLMIAAHARSLAAIVVTNNIKDFGRIKGLAVENWMS